MKRIIAMMLVLVLALSLVACGGPAEVDPATAIVGTWEAEDGTRQVFTADRSGTVAVGASTLGASWIYYESSNSFFVDYAAGTGTATVEQKEDGSLVMTFQGVEYKKVG